MISIEHVRNEPTVNSNALGIIKSGRNATIANTGTNGWVPLTAPIKGAPVRQQPTLEGTSLGAIRYERRVTIDNLGANGWVPITVPIRGYIQSDYLEYCRR